MVQRIGGSDAAKDPAVSRGSETPVEHGDDTCVFGRADQPPRSLCEKSGGSRQVDEGERPVTRAVAARLDERVVRPRERQAIDRHEGEGPPRDVHALPEGHGREQARGLLLAERLEQLGLGQVALCVDGKVENGTQAVARSAHGAPAREQGERSSACGRDQLGELVGDGGLGLRAAPVRQIGGAIEHRPVAIRKRARHVEAIALIGREPEALLCERGDRRGGEHGRHVRPEPLGQHRTDIDRREPERHLPRPGT